MPSQHEAIPSSFINGAGTAEQFFIQFPVHILKYIKHYPVKISPIFSQKTGHRVNCYPRSLIVREPKFSCADASERHGTDPMLHTAFQDIFIAVS